LFLYQEGHFMSVRIIIISTASVIVQLALTILAWGDWARFFSNPARTWLVIGSFLLLIAAWSSGSSGISGGEKHSAASKTILYAFGLVLALMTLVPLYCDRRDIWVIRWRHRPLFQSLLILCRLDF
jgi:hypothetical protein